MSEGRGVATDAPDVGPGLRKGDRMVPSTGAVDAPKFEVADLPFKVTFWRSHYDDKRRGLDWTSRRRPSVVPSVGVRPSDVLRLDAMCIMCLGVSPRFVQAVIACVLQEEMCHIEGPKSEMDDVAVRMLFN
eukprot:9475106-Pyramimonas_sp.AAC.1